MRSIPVTCLEWWSKNPGVVHEVNHSDVVADLPDADVLTDEVGAEIDLTMGKAQAPAPDDGDDAVMQRIFQLWQAV